MRRPAPSFACASAGRELWLVPPTVRVASADDAQPLADFAAAIFRDTFGADNRPEDMDAYVAEAFTAERQLATLMDPGALVLVAEDDDGIAGYAQLLDGPAPAEVTGTRPIELQRFYVASRWQGCGLASTLMREALDSAAARGARTVWLGVWERNARAIAFYEKAGFRRVGAHVFMLGRDAQTDLLMARPVPSHG